MSNDIKKIAEILKSFKLEKEIKIMEVCGTHTREFFRTGVRDIFPEHLSLVDGPGCPVCVTANEYLDLAIEIGKQHNTVIATFGDMIKVPSSYSSLVDEKASGMEIEICYSPIDALEIARKNPGKEIVFLSLGFETTAPSEAITVLKAREMNIKNFSILCGNKITVPAVKALLDMGEVNIDGFILPGHVSAIIGSDAWKFIADYYNKPGVVAGFEAPDLITGTIDLIEMITGNDIKITNAYSRVVKSEGNSKARDIMNKVFSPSDAVWRGIGNIPGSGLTLKDEFAEYNAELKFPVKKPIPKEHTGCKCGELLRGLITPVDCPLFGKACVPEHPVGPCMVSSEGPCSAYYLYGG